MRGGPGVRQQLVLVLEGRVRLDERGVGKRGVEVVGEGGRRRRRRRMRSRRRRGESVGFIVVREEDEDLAWNRGIGASGLFWIALVIVGVSTCH